MNDEWISQKSLKLCIKDSESENQDVSNDWTKIDKEWTKIDKDEFTSQFIYLAPKRSEPLMQNVTLGNKFRNGYWEREGKRNIKIKRFGKTLTKRITKKEWRTVRIWNDQWMLNMRENNIINS